MSWGGGRGGDCEGIVGKGASRLILLAC